TERRRRGSRPRGRPGFLARRRWPATPQPRSQVRTVATTVPFVDLQAQYRGIREEINAAIARVLEKSRFILGPEVEAFEHEFAAYCGTRYAIGVSSGSSALLLSLLAAGVGPGDEVITTPHTFAATTEAITHAGASIRFVDVDPLTGN